MRALVPRRITEAVGRAIHDFRDLSQRPNGSWAHARHQQELRKILRTAFGSRHEIAVQASCDDVFRPNVVMGGHDEMRQHRLGPADPPLRHCHPAVWQAAARFRRAPVAENVELPLSRASARRSVRLTITPWSTPSIAECGSSTKL